MKVLTLLLLAGLYAAFSVFDVQNNMVTLGFWGGIALSQATGILPMASASFGARLAAWLCVLLSGLATFSALTIDARELLRVEHERTRLESIRPTNREINDCYNDIPVPCKSARLVAEREAIDQKLAELPPPTRALPTQDQWIMWGAISVTVPFSLMVIGSVIGGIIRSMFVLNGYTNTNTNVTVCKRNTNTTRTRTNIDTNNTNTTQIPKHVLEMLAFHYRIAEQKGEVAKSTFWRQIKGDVPGFSNYKSKKLDYWWDEIRPTLNQKSIWQKIFTRKKQETPAPQPEQKANEPAYKPGVVTEFRRITKPI